MISILKAATREDLQGILQLQKQNLPGALSEEERKSQGFVTVVHSLEDLEKLNQIEPHIVAKADGKVVAYLLAMTAASERQIPVLRPMFDMFRQIPLYNKKVSAFPYIVVGQVCVDKAFRGTGILDQCYTYYKSVLQSKYHFAITEIAANNGRSLKAHQRIGFREVHRFTAPGGQEWVIVLWDWNSMEEIP